MGWHVALEQMEDTFHLLRLPFVAVLKLGTGQPSLGAGQLELQRALLPVACAFAGNLTILGR